MAVFLFMNFSQSLNVEEVIASESTQCKEDAVTDEILKLILAMLVGRYLYYSYWIFHWEIKSLIFADSEFIQDFELSDEIVSYFEINMAFWVSILFYPIMSYV